MGETISFSLFCNYFCSILKITPKFAIFQNRTAQMKKIFILFILLLNVTLCHATCEIIKTAGTVMSWVADSEPAIGARDGVI